MSSVPRRQSAWEICSSPKHARLPLPSIRMAIFDAACELAPTGDTRNPEKVLSQRLRMICPSL